MTLSAIGERRASASVAVLGVLLTVAAALFVPSTIYAPCSPGVVCEFNGRANFLKIALILLGLAITFAGVIVGAFKAYVSESQGRS